MDSESAVQLRTGHRMPVLGLGTWELTKETAAIVQKALDLGYRLIDTASDYGSQPGIGRALKNTDLPRSAVYIVTKVEEYEDAYEATKKDLKELQLDYADLTLIHRPPKSGSGKDLWKGLSRVREEGFAKDIGVSNYSASLLQALRDAAGEVPAVNQIEWSPFGHSQAMLDFAKKNGIVVQAYSPLTRTEKLEDQRLQHFAAKYHKTPAQILIRWNLQLGTVPIPKANQITHLEQNIGAFDFEIERQDMAALSRLNENFSSLGSAPEWVES